MKQTGKGSPPRVEDTVEGRKRMLAYFRWKLSEGEELRNIPLRLVKSMCRKMLTMRSMDSLQKAMQVVDAGVKIRTAINAKNWLADNYTGSWSDKEEMRNVVQKRIKEVHEASQKGIREYFYDCRDGILAALLEMEIEEGVTRATYTGGRSAGGDITLSMDTDQPPLT